MSELSVPGFGCYDTNRNGRISSKEIQAKESAFTKAFLVSDKQVQLDLLRAMELKDKVVLLQSVQEHYRGAGDPGSQKSCLKAAVTVGANVTANLRRANNFQDLALNTLIFMHKNIKYAGNIDGAISRDAAEWSGPQVLAEGNYNGCVESVKLFMELYKEAARQKGFTATDCAYSSSFSLSWATPENLASKQAPSGHAMVELKQAVQTLFVNAAMFEHPALSDPGQVQSDKFLTENDFVVKVDKSGKYSLAIDGRPEQYQLFGRGIIPAKQENPGDLFDPTTSNGATRLAIRKHLETSVKQ